MKSKPSGHPDLFGFKPYQDMPPHQRHSETSKAAAASIKDRRGPSHRKILDYLRAARERGFLGATDEQMQDRIPMIANTQRPRRVELVQWGYVKDSGRLWHTKSGEWAVVWELV